MEIRCGSNHFRLGQRIGTGICGDIYNAINSSTGQEVAIKFESSRRGLHVTYESMVYRLLEDGVGFAKVHWHGAVGDMNVLVMDRLGPSLEALLVRGRAAGQRALALPRVAVVGEQVLERLQFLHSKGYVHRDVKPENILLGGVEDASIVHLIDFGFARRFRDGKTGVHIANKENTRPVGSVAFSSMNAHRGGEQSRRDDLEALGHVLIYLMRGKLPWLRPGRSSESSKELSEVVAKKQQTSVEALCKHCPEEMKIFMQYCRALRFDEEPDYGFLRRLLRAAAGTACSPPSACGVEWWLEGSPLVRPSVSGDLSDPSLSPEPSPAESPIAPSVEREPRAARPPAVPVAVAASKDEAGAGARRSLFTAPKAPDRVLPSLLGRWFGASGGAPVKSGAAEASGSNDGNPEVEIRDAIIDNPEITVASDDNPNINMEFTHDSNPNTEMPSSVLTL